MLINKCKYFESKKMNEYVGYINEIELMRKRIKSFREYAEKMNIKTGGDLYAKDSEEENEQENEEQQDDGEGEGEDADGGAEGEENLNIIENNENNNGDDNNNENENEIPEVV